MSTFQKTPNLSLHVFIACKNLLKRLKCSGDLKNTHFCKYRVSSHFCKYMANFSTFFMHKIDIFRNFGMGVLVCFQYVRESQTNVRSAIYYDIVASYHVYTPTAFYIYENPIFHMWKKAFFHLCGPKRQFSVDQKVNTCWPKFQILKRNVSALCGYFYSSQNPFLGSEIVNFVKKVRKTTKPTQDPPPG